MSTEDTPIDEPVRASDESSTSAVAEPAAGDGATDVEAKVPEFAEVSERTVSRVNTSSDRLHGVSVPVWAELGRVEMLIGELLQLGEGSVIRLDRAIGDPVDIISQGVKLARGEVIVVDDCFAIRIREILSGG